MQPRERLDVLVRRWPVVVAGVLAGLALAAAVAAVTPPTYRARAQLFVSDGVDVPTSEGRPAVTPVIRGDTLRSYPAFASGPDVLEPVARQLGTTGSRIAPRIVVFAPTATQLIEVRATGPTASGAVALATAVGDRLARVVEDVGAPDGVRVRTVVPATTPAAPLWPNVPVLVVSGLLAGASAGAVGALLVERRRARSP